MRTDRLVALAALSASLVASATASAFCRTTTCDAVNPNADCNRDAHGCATASATSPYLYWPSSCTWFGVQATGDPPIGYTYSVVHDVVSGAFKAWSDVTCAQGGHPSFTAQDTDLLYGPVECGEQAYNLNSANDNVWAFISSDWPHEVNVIASTTLTIDGNTGEILDADVELNTDRSTEGGLTLGRGDVRNLQEVVTHESGHFLGLGHSDVESAVMYFEYGPNDLQLTQDDVDGICAIYPPGDAPVCPEPAPRTGFSKYCDGGDPSTAPVDEHRAAGCGCRLAPLQSRSGAVPFGVIGLFVLRRGLRLRRRGRLRAAGSTGTSTSR